MRDHTFLGKGERSDVGQGDRALFSILSVFSVCSRLGRTPLLAQEARVLLVEAPPPIAFRRSCVCECSLSSRLSLAEPVVIPSSPNQLLASVC